jgi:Uma2 family endonuclease
MTSSASSPPVAARKLTYEDYVLFPDDLLRHEIIEGEHVTNPAPGTRHQAVSRYLQFALFEQIELPGHGFVMNAPLDVQLGPHNIVQPDIVIVLKANAIVTPAKVDGVPDVVIEILSPSTRKIDWNRKKVMYERAGVKEYWIVDPDAETLHQHRLSTDGRYAEPAVCTESVTWTGLPDPVRVNLTRVWSRTCRTKRKERTSGGTPALFGGEDRSLRWESHHRG